MLLTRVVVVTGLLLTTGCGPRMYEIRGRVHFPDGSPLVAGNVTVENFDQTYGAAGQVKENGEFSIEAVPPGKYKLYLASAFAPGQARRAGANEPPEPVLMIKAKFTDPDKSGLTIDVPSDGPADITVEKP